MTDVCLNMHDSFPGQTSEKKCIYNINCIYYPHLDLCSSQLYNEPHIRNSAFFQNNLTRLFEYKCGNGVCLSMGLDQNSNCMFAILVAILLALLIYKFVLTDAFI